MPSEIKTVLSTDAFQAPANFSHARVINGIVYAAGQIPLDTTGKKVGESIQEQTEQVIKNHAAILKAAGSGLDRILRINVYLVDPEEYNGFAEVYARMIPDPKPARGCIFVKALPAASKVEMDLIAAVN